MAENVLNELRQAIEITFKDFVRPDGGAGLLASEVDVEIREQTNSGVFPIRLPAEDWSSGDKLWLLDIIAPNRKLATAVLANFKHIAKGKPVSMHPIVGRSVGADVMEKMRVGAGEKRN